MKLSTLSILLWAGWCASVVGAQTRPLITHEIDATQLVVLRGNVHPLARAQYDRGAVPDNLALPHLRLLLNRAPQTEQALVQFIEQLYDPAWPDYHHWLTPEQTGRQFGADQQDIDALVAWLGVYGFEVSQVYPNHVVIEFSGTAGQVREAFHTAIHRYFVKGQEHWAAAADPRIPAALGPAVRGIAKLNDFPARPLHREGARVTSNGAGKWRPVEPVADATLSFYGNEYYLVAPYDFAAIYNVLPLWSAGTSGEGQTIALVEDSNINPDDVAAFRSGLGLPALGANQLAIVCATGSDCSTNADETEGAIDAEWSGAVAPGATILYVAANSLEDSASYIVNNNAAPIVSISYSECESDLGTSGNAFWSGLWQTAALQGQTVSAAAGDFGGAICDADVNPAAPDATLGLSVNGIASTPYNVAIGGTDFSDTFAGTNSFYWAATNSSGTMQSAISYVPEMSWNNSCASNVLSGFLGFPPGEATCELLPSFFGTNPLNVLNIAAGSGGPSTCATGSGSDCQGYAKPTWQANVDGVANDGVRDLPDVSLFSSDNAWSHAYIFCMSDPNENGMPCDYTSGEDTVYNSGGGTSFAAPAFAGIIALINQQTGSVQGNASYVLYSLAGAEYGTSANPNTEALSACNAGEGNEASSTCLFYDVTQGDTTVPCQTGSANCYTVNAGDQYGVLSTSTTSLAQAYKAAAGWDFATGLGSVNVANLAGGWTTSATYYVISGQVTLNGEALQGAALSLTGGRNGSATTNSSGKFNFVVPGGKPYTVTPSLNGYTFNPPNYSVEKLTRNESADFTGAGTRPDASLSTGSISFGDQGAGLPSLSQTVLLRNTGNGTLTLSSLAVSGANARDFTATDGCGALPSQIAVNATCPVSVVFDPSVAGAESATLTFTDNSGGVTGSTQTVSLSGTGMVLMSFNPASVSFGYAGVHIASESKPVEITNSSAIAVTISSITVSGTDASDFKASSNCGTSMAASAKCTVTVIFDPAAAGARSASLAIADSGTGSPQSVALTGTGTEKAVMELSASSLTFPATAVGAASSPKVVTVTNAGHAALTILGVSPPANFAQTNNCTATLASGASCTVSVTFDPTQTGKLTGTLTVTGNGVVFDQEVKLSGTGE